MNWWLNLYFAEGPGIAKDAPKPTGLKRVWATFAREWWNLVALNLLFIAASLPLVTLPAAWVAMMRVAGVMVEDEPVEVWRDFREAFVARFWRALGAGALATGLVALGVLAVVTYGERATGQLAFAVPLALAGAVLVFTLLFAVALFVLVAGPAAPFHRLVQAAALTALARPLPLLAAVAANGALWGVHVLAYPSTVLLAVTLNFSLGGLLLAFAAHETAHRVLGHLSRRAQYISDRMPDPIPDPVRSGPHV